MGERSRPVRARKRRVCGQTPGEPIVPRICSCLDWIRPERASALRPTSMPMLTSRALKPATSRVGGHGRRLAGGLHDDVGAPSAGQLHHPVDESAVGRVERPPRPHLPGQVRARRIGLGRDHPGTQGRGHGDAARARSGRRRTRRRCRWR